MPVGCPMQLAGGRVRVSMMLRQGHHPILTRVASSRADGMVIANDSDSKRCYLLVHQSKRLDSPCFVVTNDDGTRYPNIYQDPSAPGGAPAPMLFDRVLCDVPCRCV